MTNTIERNFIEDAISAIQENKYGAAAHQLSKTDETELQAECERLADLLGNHSKSVGGKLGVVIGNYTDRLITELAKKAHPGEEGE